MGLFEQTTVLNALITAAPMAVDAAVQKALKESAQQVQKTAKGKFSEYQPAYGPFQAWALLNRDYVIEKIAAGASGDDPLIGAYFKRESRDAAANSATKLRDSIEIKVEDVSLTAYVGTNNMLGVYHEYGAVRKNSVLPPRPFLRPALYQETGWINKTMREAIGLGMVSWFK
ncbi:hypothetical protein [Alicyclobacillus acidoterrestris]|uniref:Uncharacterized protein n=1 Tax=Alicyclobacillus acidoterrestris (strain ATCC 49025 / DSM 3922 / CIP 106132 / NCIMB 13137 / GD3B) TaxID=1356854 RepID=T0DDB6_ALIAG|nr:hypothetical protein [Alicyclobacillus acidoterrestris]EPZ47636.1 hypothetical protein N007_05100 [Alicyclobacillus acidoterrestris ATCC 49025]UNO48044.1 hypothetical protein K1I37_15330 [Alicyclobacillus acidoterrestris]